jgi:hypothetical protein
MPVFGEREMAKGGGWRGGARWLGMVLAALPLCACNTIVSSEPWFVGAPGAPQLRDGVWRADSDKPCDLDEKQPVQTWPTCAFGVVVRASDLTLYERDDKGQVKPSTVSYVLAAGDPVILQLDDTTAKPPQFEYAWLTPVRRDGQGRIIELRGGGVGCGGRSGAGANGQPAPYPGVTTQNGACRAGSADVLRAAAKSSVGDSDPKEIAHVRWLRAGDR